MDIQKLALMLGLSEAAAKALAMMLRPVLSQFDKINFRHKDVPREQHDKAVFQLQQVMRESGGELVAVECVASGKRVFGLICMHPVPTAPALVQPEPN